MRFRTMVFGGWVYSKKLSTTELKAQVSKLRAMGFTVEVMQ